MKSRLLSAGLTAAALAALAACGPDRGASPAAWQAQVDTIGDTVVVRTIAGSAWRRAELVPEVRIGALEGERHEMLGDVRGLAVGPDGDLYLYDAHGPALRRYGADGRYLATLGREGGGPGEYRNPDGGLIVLPDGRVVLRDPGNGRFTVFGPDDAYVASWPGPGGMFTGTPLLPGPDGGFLNHTFGPGLTGWNLVRYGPDGSAGDTVRVPTPAHTAATVEGRSPDGQAVQRWGVPFTARTTWALAPDGDFLTAITDRYAIDRHRRDGSVLRIERVATPIPVSAGERAHAEDRVTTGMRRLDQGWRWDGPRIPDTKPFLQGLYAGRDGRIWVHLHQPGVPSAHDPEPGPDGRVGPRAYREPVVFDVFEPDGRYLGQVTAPDGFAVFPWPVFGADQVWAIERDELDVQYGVSYRLRVDAPDSPIQENP